MTEIEELLKPPKVDAEEEGLKPNISHNGDINTGYLVMRIDKGIRHKIRLIDDERGRKWRRIYMKIKWVKGVGVGILVLLTFFERPSWCLTNPNITDYWYCNDASGGYPNSDIPKLPQGATIIIELVTLYTLLAFTLLQRMYKRSTLSSHIYERV